MEGLLFVPPVLTLGVTQGSAAALHTVTPVCLQQHSGLGVVCKHIAVRMAVTALAAAGTALGCAVRSVLPLDQKGCAQSWPGERINAKPPCNIHGSASAPALPSVGALDHGQWVWVILGWHCSAPALLSCIHPSLEATICRAPGGSRCCYS